MIHCPTSPSLFFFSIFSEYHWCFFWFSTLLFVAVLQSMGGRRDKIKEQTSPPLISGDWLLSLHLSVGIMIPAVNSSTWFDSRHGTLLIHSIPWRARCLCEWQGQTILSIDWWLTTVCAPLLTCNLRGTAHDPPAKLRGSAGGLIEGNQHLSNRTHSNTDLIAASKIYIFLNLK